MRRSGEICGAYGGRVFHDIRDYQIEYSDQGNSCIYHRQTHILGDLVERVKSSEPSWIGVRGKNHICVVTFDVPGDTPNLFNIFSAIPAPEAIVSVIPDTGDTQAGGAHAAISEYNEMLAIMFLKKILSGFGDLSYSHTVLIATIAFSHLLSRNIMPNELKILVAGRDKLTTMSLPIDKTKFFLDVSHGVTKGERIVHRSVSCAVSLLQDSGMGSLETSDTYVGNETGYHRRTHIFDDGQSVQIVKSSGTSWIAVRGQEALCIVNCGTSLEKPEKSDLLQSFKNPFFVTKAIVSVALGSSDVLQGGNVTVVSIADSNEKSAVDFLVKKTSNRLNFTYKETIQTAINAHRCLFPENVKADENEIEIYVLRNAEQNFRVLSVRDMEAHLNSIQDIEALDNFNSEVTSSGPRQYLATRKKKRRMSYNRETHIWCGGWDSKLLYSFGFSWIAVQGKDSVCVVTVDEKADTMVLRRVINHMIGNEVFGIKYQPSEKSRLMRPFTAVSVFVDFGDIDKERSHAVSQGEVTAANFLAKKLNDVSDSTYETIVQVAMSALLCLTQNDLHAKEIKACVFRKGKLPAEDIIAVLPINEIDEYLGHGKTKAPGEDSASPSKRSSAVLILM